MIETTDSSLNNSLDNYIDNYSQVQQSQIFCYSSPPYYCHLCTVTPEPFKNRDILDDIC